MTSGGGDGSIDGTASSSCPAPIDVVKETGCAPDGIQCASTDQIITCDGGSFSYGSPCKCAGNFWACALPTCNADGGSVTDGSVDAMARDATDSSISDATAD